MAVSTLDGYIRIPAGAVLPAYVLVTAAGVVVAGAQVTKVHVGLTQEIASAVGKLVTLINPTGKYAKVLANAAFAAGAALYYDANGAVGTTATSNTQIGVAIDAATGAGSIVTVAFL